MSCDQDIVITANATGPRGPKGAPGPAKAITHLDSPYQMMVTDTNLVVDASAGDVSILLPAIAFSVSVACFILRTDVSANALTISGDETIFGQPSLAIVAQDNWTLVYPNEDLSDWLALGVQDIYPRSGVSVFDFIPRQYWAAILNYTSTVDVSAYLTTAHAFAGIGGKIFYPSGTYRCVHVQYLSQQRITGAGKGTVLQQLDNSNLSVLVSSEWYNNITTARQGANISDISFSPGAGTTGGYGILDIYYKDKFERVNFVGLGLYLTATTRNGSKLNKGQTQNHTIVNCDFTGCPNGAIYTANSKVTDTWIRGNNFNNCGTGQTIGVIDAYTSAGWQILDNKFYGSPGRMMNIRNSFQNTSIIGNNIDWACTVPDTVAMNYGIYLKENVKGGLVFANNVCRLDSEEHPTYAYTFLYVDTGSINGAITHTGNRYYAQTGVAAAFTASMDATGVMTVTAVSSGTIGVGKFVSGAGVQTTQILSQISGTTGGIGTYEIDIPQTVLSEAMTINAFGSSSNITAFAVSNPLSTFGASVGNYYDGFTLAQHGSGEATLGLTASKLFASPMFLQPGTNAFLSAAEALGTPSPGRARAFVYDDLFAAIGPTILAKLDVFYFFAGADTIISTVNLANPTFAQAALIGGPTFVSDRGFTGDGVDAYIDTGHTYLSFTNYDLGNGSMYAWVGNNIEDSNPIIGSLGTNLSFVNPRNTGGNFSTRSQTNGTTSNSSTADSIGGFGWSRLNDLNNYSRYIDGALVNSVAVTATTIGTNNAVFLMNNAGFSLWNIQAGYIGGGLTTGEVLIIDTAVKAALTAIGAPT